MTPIAPDRPILILTGAGISKESGLDTFRCAGGLWSHVRLEDVATPEAFARDPGHVHAFYNARRRGLLAAAVEPNPAHHALVRLERDWPGGVILVTQNIDDLHERAGSRSLIHMHGELLKIRCTRCDRPFAWRDDLDTATPCPDCGQPGRLRPHVVWFGEIPLALDRIEAAIGACGLFVSIGTSGSVYPAAGFVSAVRQVGRAHTVEINLEPSEGASLFAEKRYGPAGTLVPAFVDELLGTL